MKAIPRHYRVELLAAVLLLAALAGLWSGIIGALHRNDAAARQAAIASTSLEAAAYADSVAHDFDTLDQIALLVRDLVVTAPDPSHLDLTHWGQSHPFTSGLAARVLVTDATGHVIASNLGAATPDNDFSGRDFWRAQQQATLDRPFISSPLLTAISNIWTIALSRRLTDPAGHFSGVVVVYFNTAFLNRFTDALDLSNGSATLVGDDGLVRARRPSLTGTIGLPVSTAIKARMLSGSGSYDARSADSIDRLYSFHHVAGYPLIATIGLDQGRIREMAQKWRIALIVAGVGASAILIALAALALALRRTQARTAKTLAFVLGHTGSGMVLTDRQGRVRHINSIARHLLNAPPWSSRRRQMLRELDPAPPTPQGRITRPDGTELEIHRHSTPDGGMLHTYIDITERLKTEAALTAARAAAGAASRARAEFLAVISHEIRTPMNGILGVADLLLDMPLGADEKHYLRIIMDSGNHLLQMINDILDFSRLDSGRLELDEGAFDIRGLVHSAVDLLAAQARAKELDLTVTAGEDVPLRAGGDARRLRQVLLNLVGNAIKFTDAGHVRVGVTLVGREPGAIRLGFTVADTGIGIEAASLPRLFDGFTQADSSASRRFGGSGLGLAISRRLIERMGGRITVVSTPRQGSTFSFDVKLRARRASDTGAAPRAALPVPAGGRVLVAEDNPTNRLVVTRLLERMGHRVDAVEDGAKAVEAVGSQNYDLVLMDVMMPEMDGHAATRAIRAREAAAGTPALPIIGLSANAMTSDETDALQAGMTAFTTKPITLEKLTAVIEKAMAGHTPRDAQVAVEMRSFDPASLDAIVRDIGAEATAELVRHFSATASRQIAEMQALAEGGELNALMRQANDLARIAGNLGLMRLARAAAEVENNAAGEQRVTATETIQQCRALLQSGLDELHNWRMPTGM